MPAYLFHIELPVFTPDIMAAIPAHRLHINKLFAEGRILSYSVSANRDQVWCVVNAEDEQEAMELVIAFPLSANFVDVTCTALMFHNTLPASLPGIFLN